MEIRSGPGQDIRLTIAGSAYSVFRVEASTNLRDWREIALFMPETDRFGFRDLGVGDLTQRFYRLTTADRDETNDWKNQVAFPWDPFAAGGGGTSDQVRWIKFLILPGEPARVYFQDSQKYVLHFTFAQARFPAFATLDRAAFDQVTLHPPQQQAVLGAVLFPPGDEVPEFAVQFAGQDPYPRELIARYFPVVCAAVEAGPGVQAYYFPAYEQGEAAAADEGFFAQRGIKLGSPYRWIQGNQVYSAGWALGRLRFIPAAEINTAYSTGRLQPGDILLTDGIPAELPFVSGILSLVPATPNSHVAILASAYQVPFGYVADPAVQVRLRQLADREILLQCSTRYGLNRITPIEVEGKIDDAARREILQLKLPPPAHITPKASWGALSASTDGLRPADIRFFGGKAAHYGILRRVIPQNCEPAVAFSFDLWDAYLDQKVAGGASLHQTIQTKLGTFTNYPPNMGIVKARLAEVRELIARNTVFSPEQKQAIFGALSPFATNRNLRFRSSSNAEDSKTFAAAGLYDSYSGCLADDLDGDDAGPSHADPTEPNERGVFRAMRKVYASFYNDNAFLERLRNGIDESQVGMALLVHYSTPDNVEMANGVARLSRNVPQFFGPAELTANLVTQKGAVSIANPEDNSRPEIVDVGESAMPWLRQSSSRVPLGDSVLEWDREYLALFDMMRQVYTNYCDLAGYSIETGNPLLDFEYKKVEPGWLVIKQVRELPGEDSGQTEPYLLNDPATFWVFQTEQSDVMANHRLKGWLTLETANLRLTASNLATCFYTHARFEYRVGNEIRILTGPPATWSDAAHTVTLDPRGGYQVRDSWSVGSGPERRVYSLTTFVPKIGAVENLVVTVRDLKKSLSATYATPETTLGYDSAPKTTSQEEVQLVVSPAPAGLQPQSSEILDPGKGLRIEVSFLASNESGEGPLPSIEPNPYGTFPAFFSSWAHATITGLLPEPIQLKNYYATSARAGHKLMYTWFVLEPALDPDLPANQRAALEAANVRLIHVYREFLSRKTTAKILGTDGQFRDW
jgi:hypothetical protein